MDLYCGDTSGGRHLLAFSLFVCAGAAPVCLPCVMRMNREAILI